MILRTRSRLEQRREPGVAVAGVVVDDREVARAVRDQRVDELGRACRRCRSRRSSRSRRRGCRRRRPRPMRTVLSITALLLRSCTASDGPRCLAHQACPTSLCDYRKLCVYRTNFVRSNRSLSRAISDIVCVNRPNGYTLPRSHHRRGGSAHGQKHPDDTRQDPRIARRNRLVAGRADGRGRHGDPNFMTSLARGLAVIRAFSQQRKNLSIAQISHQTGIPRAAVRRCLHTLARLGYVTVDARGFSLSPKILTLGHAYLSSTPLSASAQPLLDRIAAAVHESCSMAILEEDEILYVARSAATTRIMSVDLSIGSRLPAYCTSMGRVLLAWPVARRAAALLRTGEARPLHPVHADGARQATRRSTSCATRVFRSSTRSWKSDCARSPCRYDGHGKAVAAINIGTQAYARELEANAAVVSATSAGRGTRIGDVVA